jgi:xanthine dehydrogenase YagR molybdenum-binding subunit
MRKEHVAGTASRQADYGAENKKAGGTLGGVQFAEVTVDTLTGVVRVERVVAAQDCGRPMNPLLVESQIHGGVIQGVSYALFEERRLDRRSGRMLNANLEQYKIAGALDVPRIDVVLLEELTGRTSTDARGIGEPATVPTAAAIANAVYNAIGVRIRELPITPARVLAALAEKPAAAPGAPSPARTSP